MLSATPDRRALGQRLMAQLVPQLQAFRQQQGRPGGMPAGALGPKPPMSGAPSQKTILPQALQTSTGQVPGSGQPVVAPPPPGAGLTQGLTAGPPPQNPGAQQKPPVPQGPPPLAPKPGTKPIGTPSPVTAYNPTSALQADQGIGGGPSIQDFIKYLIMTGQGTGGGNAGMGGVEAAAGNAGAGGGMGNFG